MGRKSFGSPPRGNHRPILWAEDNEADRVLIARCLTEVAPDCATHFVKDGQQALDLLRAPGNGDSRPPFDLVVLDLNLPCYSGLEILRELRSEETTAELHICIFTSVEEERSVEKARELGASAYFLKPLVLTEFFWAVAEIVGPSSKVFPLRRTMDVFRRRPTDSY